MRCCCSDVMLRRAAVTAGGEPSSDTSLTYPQGSGSGAVLAPVQNLRLIPTAAHHRLVPVCLSIDRPVNPLPSLLLVSSARRITTHCEDP